MASAWGSSWGSAWGDSWGGDAAAETPAAASVGSARRRPPEFVVYEEPEKTPDLAEFEFKAIQRQLDRAPPDDLADILALQNQLRALRIVQPQYKPLRALDRSLERALKRIQDDDDEAILNLLLH